MSYIYVYVYIGIYQQYQNLYICLILGFQTRVLVHGRPESRACILPGTFLGARRVRGGRAEGARRVRGGRAEGARRVRGGCAEGARRVRGGCAEGVRRVRGGIGEGARRVRGGCAEGEGRVRGGCVEGARRANLDVVPPFWGVVQDCLVHGSNITFISWFERALLTRLCLRVAGSGGCRSSGTSKFGAFEVQ